MECDKFSTGASGDDLQARGAAPIVMGSKGELRRFMTSQLFFEELEKRIAKYDLLCHPFYQAWSAGELTREELRDYALDYYHHVDAFPEYLAAFGIRLDDGELRRAVLANMRDEQGGEDVYGEPGRSHAELWLDFAEGMGARRTAFGHSPASEVRALVDHFSRVATLGTVEETLAAFYAYESQVPRIAAEKDRGLREDYGADERTRYYFTLHTTADVYHSNVWKQQLKKRIEAQPETAEKALNAAEGAAKALWRALDGIESRRMAEVA
jgi:pyrroloquinoline-quinone synthase